MPRALAKDRKAQRLGSHRAARDDCPECCDDTRRFVKFTDCCDPRNYSWWEVGPLTHPDDATKMLLRIGTPPLQCFVSDPGRVLTFAEVVALGDVGRITPGQPNPGDMVPGECTAEDCPSCRCCSSGTIRRCNTAPNAPPTCCSCGSVFRLTFQSRIRVHHTRRFVDQSIACIAPPGSGGCIDPCSGAAVDEYCYAPWSAEVTELSATRNVTFTVRYECDNQGHWTATCLNFSIDYRRESTAWEGWNPFNGQWPACPPNEGYTPRFNGVIEESCAGSGCDFLDEINGFPPHRTCEPYNLPDQFAACSIDLFNARGFAGTLGTEIFNYLDPAWVDEYYAKCSGERVYNGPACEPPFCQLGCSRTAPGDVHRLLWTHDIRCGRGQITDRAEVLSVRGNKFYNLDAFWTVTQDVPCAGEDPCDGELPPPADPVTDPQLIVTTGPVTFATPAVGRPSHISTPAVKRRGCSHCGGGGFAI